MLIFLNNKYATWPEIVNYFKQRLYIGVRMKEHQIRRSARREKTLPFTRIGFKRNVQSRRELEQTPCHLICTLSILSWRSFSLSLYFHIIYPSEHTKYSEKRFHIFTWIWKWMNKRRKKYLKQNRILQFFKTLCSFFIFKRRSEANFTPSPSHPTIKMSIPPLALVFCVSFNKLAFLIPQFCQICSNHT